MKNTDIELWRPVLGFEGRYEVSDLGRVRSLDRISRRSSKFGLPYDVAIAGTILRPCVNTKRHGYRQVNLSGDTGNYQRRVCVLVAAAFHGPRPPGYVTCHFDGDPQNDCAANLRYDTPKNNSADMIRHGTLKRGAEVKNARLSEADVRRIKYGKEDARLLARDLGVHPGHVSNIRAGFRWAHV